HRVEALGKFGWRENVDIPVGQAGSQSNVLPALADRQAELIFIDHHRGAAEFKAEADFHNFRRLQRVLNQNLAGLVPAHDVDFFATQFVDDVLNSATAHTDAGTHGIDLRVDRTDSNLGAVAGLARHRLDFDNALRNFRNFHLKQSLDEFGLSTTKHDLDLVTHI